MQSVEKREGRKISLLSDFITHCRLKLPMETFDFQCPSETDFIYSHFLSLGSAKNLFRALGCFLPLVLGSNCDVPQHVCGSCGDRKRESNLFANSLVSKGKNHDLCVIMTFSRKFINSTPTQLSPVWNFGALATTWKLSRWVPFQSTLLSKARELKRAKKPFPTNGCGEVFYADHRQRAFCFSFQTDFTTL